MDQNYRPEPEVDNPSYYDWDEMCNYFDSLDAAERDEIEREILHEANMELAQTANENEEVY